MLLAPSPQTTEFMCFRAMGGEGVPLKGGLGNAEKYEQVLA